MDIPTELVAQFCGVTNADETLASQLLRDSGLDLEAAIQSFFAIQEAGGLPSDSSDNPEASSTTPQPPERRVRPPIPQMVDTLLPNQPRHVNRHQPTRSDPFAESDGTRNGDLLAALFRPPTHLSFSGSFEDAMVAGQNQKRWLLVNVQSMDVFASHIMNRDVWADRSVEELLQSHFVFWQRDESHSDGARYKHFYNFTQGPHVAVIDPRSGERVRVWGGDGEPIQKDVLVSELVDFVTANSLDNPSSVPPPARAGQPSTRTPTTRPASQVGAPSTAGTSSAAATGSEDGMGTEDAALAAAIAASMEDTDTIAGSNSAPGENGHGYTAPTDINRQTSRLLSATDPELNSRRSLRAQQDNAYEESLAMDRAMEESKKEEARRVESAAEEEVRRAKQMAEMREQKRRRIPPLPPSSTDDKVTELAIRLPNGQRLQRRFFASNTIGSVYDYIESECEDLAQANFELMQAYPKKSYADRDVSLTELAPKAALVVHLKD